MSVELKGYPFCNDSIRLDECFIHSDAHQRKNARRPQWILLIPNDLLKCALDPVGRCRLCGSRMKGD